MFAPLPQETRDKMKGMSEKRGNVGGRAASLQLYLYSCRQNCAVWASSALKVKCEDDCGDLKPSVLPTDDHIAAIVGSIVGFIVLLVLCFLCYWFRRSTSRYLQCDTLYNINTLPTSGMFSIMLCCCVCRWHRENPKEMPNDQPNPVDEEASDAL